MGNLVDHACRELEKVGEDPEVTAGIIKVVEAFSKMGHSGASSMYTIQILTELLQYKNLSPLTDDPSEWHYISADIWGGEEGVWQNIRNSEAFSNDRGKSYYLLSEGGHDRNRRPLHKTRSHKL